MRRLAAALLLVLALGDCGKDDVKDVRADTTTSSDEITTTSIAAESTTTTGGKVGATTTTAQAANLVHEKKCTTAKSTNEEPNNQPLSIEVCIDDSRPSETQKVTLTVTADDPDAPVGTGDCDIAVWWQGDPGSLCRDVVIPPGQNDPQRVPEHGHAVKSFEHIYTDPGEYTIDVYVWSGPGDGHPDPYDNYAAAQLKVSVQ